MSTCPQKVWDICLLLEISKCTNVSLQTFTCNFVKPACPSFHDMTSQQHGLHISLKFLINVNHPFFLVVYTDAGKIKPAMTVSLVVAIEINLPICHSDSCHDFCQQKRSHFDSFDISQISSCKKNSSHRPCNSVFVDLCLES